MNEWTRDLELLIGPCCRCGTTALPVRTILMLPFQAPVAGQGWACLQCGLPPDGALAVVCDACAQFLAGVHWHAEDLRLLESVCAGALADGHRLRCAEFRAVPFAHEPRHHPELDGPPAQPPALPRQILPTDRMFPGADVYDIEEPCSRCGRAMAGSDDVSLFLWRANGDMWRFCPACAGWDTRDAGPVMEDPFHDR